MWPLFFKHYFVFVQLVFGVEWFNRYHLPTFLKLDPRSPYQIRFYHSKHWWDYFSVFFFDIALVNHEEVLEEGTVLSERLLRVATMSWLQNLNNLLQNIPLCLLILNVIYFIIREYKNVVASVARINKPILFINK